MVRWILDLIVYIFEIFFLFLIMKKSRKEQSCLKLLTAGEKLSFFFFSLHNNQLNQKLMVCIGLSSGYMCHSKDFILWIYFDDNRKRIRYMCVYSMIFLLETTTYNPLTVEIKNRTKKDIHISWNYHVFDYHDKESTKRNACTVPGTTFFFIFIFFFNLYNLVSYCDIQYWWMYQNSWTISMELFGNFIFFLFFLCFTRFIGCH